MQEKLLDKLINKINENSPNVNIESIIKAFYFAKEAHCDQKRESGEPYIVHPVEVACILAEMGMDTDTIVSGLLHDVIEDTRYTHEEMEKEFGSGVADLVEGVTKLDKLEFKSKEEQQAENVRKMLMAMAKDVRVILIKLADRLHNMRTLKYMSIEKQKEKAKETFDIYAPLAHRLGMSKIKWELEDLAFRYTNPNEYYDLVRKIAEKRVEREAYINQIVLQLKENLLGSNIEAEIDGRPKHFYSIYRKMMMKSKTVDQIFDLTAVRIMVESIKDCYTALGIVHTIYKPIPGRFKDYIAMPKPNMYQSLHSTVIGPLGKPFEIQIRTYDMHKTAEYGIAAHWKYKEGETSEDTIDKKLTWLRELLDWQGETSDAEEFMEGFKIDLFADEVFVFTPKGTVINLPNEATPIDFAYRIHTDIGNRCIGARVNSKMVPLDYKLKTGEIVEILTSPIAKGPSIDWLSIVKSNQAKGKIRAWFKKAKREENIEKGKDSLEKEAKKQEFNFGEIAKGQALIETLKKCNYNSIEDLYAVVGTGEVLASLIIQKLKENQKGEKKPQASIKEETEQISKNLKDNTNKNIYKNNMGITVKGESNLLVRFAKCCNPVPGDDITGYITKGRGVSVHRSDCKNVENLKDGDGNRVVEVTWGETQKDGYSAEIQVKAENRDGLLAEIMETLSLNKTFLYSISASCVKSGYAVIDAKVRISDIEDLKNIMRQIKKLQGVKEIYRTKN